MYIKYYEVTLITKLPAQCPRKCKTAGSTVAKSRSILLCRTRENKGNKVTAERWKGGFQREKNANCFIRVASSRGQSTMHSLLRIFSLFLFFTTLCQVEFSSFGFWFLLSLPLVRFVRQSGTELD